MGKLKQEHINCSGGICKFNNPHCPNVEVTRLSHEPSANRVESIMDHKKELSNRYFEYLRKVYNRRLDDALRMTLDDDLPDVMDDIITQSADTLASIAVQVFSEENNGRNKY